MNAPTAAEARVASESSRRLSKISHRRSNKNLQFRVRAQGGAEEVISVPSAAFKLFADLLRYMAKGNGVALVPLDSEVTTQQAANLLNVSRPFLIDQLEKRLIPFRKVGTHRRVLIRDLMTYKRRMDRNRLKALDELSSLDQKLGLGY
ncbi:MAG TPA: excisionase family DNA-binding protein [Tepidisphaeraceae bacterium]|nr:excisionase family DNA-binding protein [Tepidisphaeraceae bacterium]